jgi:DNA-binding CsgD family transcriptional regulator
MSTARFLELSTRAASLLGTTPEEGRGQNYVDFTTQPEQAAAAFELARAGLIDGVSSRRTFKTLDGGHRRLRSYAHVVRLAPEPELGLWVVPEDEPAAVESVFADVGGTPAAPDADAPSFTLGVSDGRWTASRTRGGASLQSGQPADGGGDTALVDLVHPFDLAAVLLGLARATTDPSASVRARLRGDDGSWVREHMVIALTAPRFDVALTVATVATGPGVSIDLDAILALPALRELPSRQHEVVTRLLRGERVATIAGAMYLSASTVRNHLTAVFRKFDVHSQEELLGTLRQQRFPDSHDE